MKKFTLLTLVLCLTLTQANAKKWRVNNTPGVDADFTTFKTAHDGASSGDTLYFEGSPTAYGENDTITKTLVIIGPGYLLHENDSSQANVATAKLKNLIFVSGSAGSVITGMYFTGYVSIGANNITIERNYLNSDLRLYYIFEGNTYGCANCIIKQNYSTSNIFASSPGASNVLIYNNIFNYIYFSHSGSSAIIKNNIFTYLGNDGIGVYNSTIRNNITYGGILTNTGNLIQNNLTSITEADVFVLTGSSDGKYKLKEGSPAIGAGHDGVDCGIFGGSQPYVLSGIPAGPHIFDANVATSGSNEGGLPVTLKIKTQN